ncbi:UbiD family decarboxylase [Botrimarina mediterranea]|uniref:4-hydroxybenzoate decarboxylase subunit C n=1 Tax=Botrimarina mediterranea TaxID=2528022 RepID=A0A518K332_9BACT|nr:UbiD family decarboxylase [Botrimarina mediterranea]QDV72213.1 4-hydroxybenzoate decarboxylase subunit C [Botrimarina mediterranea]QDV76757.1 4-hydroxybenzoate decarboxylase subunit C [Planctomycetes bacterium K2D]
MSLRSTLLDLERHGHLRRIDAPVDAYLEAAAIHRRVFAAGGPALWFTNVTGCRFSMASNLFGTLERSKFLFRHTFESVQRLIDLKVDPTRALKSPLKYATTPFAALRMLPKSVRSGPVMACETTISSLPNLVSWPRDGGPFVTLPQVYTEDPHAPGLMKSNLGMYRIQLAGNEYERDSEIGLHYQLHRSIGVHQAEARRLGKPFRVNTFVGGHPAMTLAAVMPLPEGMSELTFAGALAGRRIRMVKRREGLPVYADADFAICGTVVPGENGAGGLPRMKPEGPFGDHLGYYSLQHPFPVLRVERVYHRRDAVWPFTVVGRPPQEDTAFGELIHDLTGPVIPTVLPGVLGVNAVDAAGVHPLLLAVGSERYMPFNGEPRPQEILTQASAILGQGQLSLAKFLFIADAGCWQSRQEATHDLHAVRPFLEAVLRRADWTRDLHFHTRTTIDTLDYSGDSLNAGSKVIIAAAGPAKFELATQIGKGVSLPDGFDDARVVTPGVVVLRGPKLPAPSFDYDAAWRGDVSGEVVEAEGLAKPQAAAEHDMERFVKSLPLSDPLSRFRLIIVADDPDFVAAASGREGIGNFLWTAFTRANPAADLYGVAAFTDRKHWGCRGPLVIDARIKPHHAPVLEEDPQVTSKTEAMAAQGGPLHGLF